MSNNPIVDRATQNMAGYYTPSTSGTEACISRFEDGHFLLTFGGRVAHTRLHLNTEDAEWLGAELTRMATDARAVEQAAANAVAAMQPVPDISTLVEGIEIIGADMARATGVDTVLAGQDDEGAGV